MEIPVPVCSGGTDMKKDEGFSVEVESRYEGWWRYNVTILCGCFDADGDRIGFASAESVVAPVGSDLSAPPEGAAAAAAPWCCVRKSFRSFWQVSGSGCCLFLRERCCLRLHRAAHAARNPRDRRCRAFRRAPAYRLRGRSVRRHALQNQPVVGRVARNQTPQRREAVSGVGSAGLGDTRPARRSTGRSAFTCVAFANCGAARRSDGRAHSCRVPKYTSGRRPRGRSRRVPSRRRDRRRGRRTARRTW